MSAQPARRCWQRTLPQNELAHHGLGCLADDCGRLWPCLVIGRPSDAHSSGRKPRPTPDVAFSPSTPCHFAIRVAKQSHMAHAMSTMVGSAVTVITMAQIMAAAWWVAGGSQRLDSRPVTGRCRARSRTPPRVVPGTHLRAAAAVVPRTGPGWSRVLPLSGR
jgi:hypothetical protein